MSNLTIILTSVLISFLCCAIFMSVYKEENSEKLRSLTSRLNDAWTQIHILQDQVYVYSARVYDLENKLKEMEKLDDGK